MGRADMEDNKRRKNSGAGVEILRDLLRDFVRVVEGIEADTPETARRIQSLMEQARHHLDEGADEDHLMESVEMFFQFQQELDETARASRNLRQSNESPANQRARKAMDSTQEKHMESSMEIQCFMESMELAATEGSDERLYDKFFSDKAPDHADQERRMPDPLSVEEDKASEGLTASKFADQKEAAPSGKATSRMSSERRDGENSRKATSRMSSERRAAEPSDKATSRTSPGRKDGATSAKSTSRTSSERREFKPSGKSASAVPKKPAMSTPVKLKAAPPRRSQAVLPQENQPARSRSASPAKWMIPAFLMAVATVFVYMVASLLPDSSRTNESKTSRPKVETAETPVPPPEDFGLPLPEDFGIPETPAPIPVEQSRHSELFAIQDARELAGRIRTMGEARAFEPQDLPALDRLWKENPRRGEVRRVVLLAVNAVGTEESRAWLDAAMAASGQEKLEFLEFLWQSGQKKSEDLVLRLFREESDSDTLGSLAFFLAEKSPENPRVQSALSEKFESTSAENLRSRFLRAMGGMKIDQHRFFLRIVQNEKRVAVRIAALDAMQANSDQVPMSVEDKSSLLLNLARIALNADEDPLLRLKVEEVMNYISR